MIAPPSTPVERSTAPAYRDRQLSADMKELRASVKHHPRAQAALTRVETRLRYILRVLRTWDETHATKAETLIQLGNPEAAQTSAQMIFCPELRADLLGRARIGGDAGADERMAEALELGRTIE